MWRCAETVQDWTNPSSSARSSCLMRDDGVIALCRAAGLQSDPRASLDDSQLCRLLDFSFQPSPSLYSPPNCLFALEAHCV
jgi:hypothetical protein